jgi:hypothetical protein
MNVAELITKLSKYPPHFEVNAAVIDHSGEVENETAEVVDVVNVISEKIVSLELDGVPS